MKTPYQVEQELARLERLVPHIISDQGERAEEILGFHVASLMQSSAASEHGLIRERTASMTRACRAAYDADWSIAGRHGLLAQPQLA